MARISSSLSMAEGFSIRGHETRTYLCACHLGFYSANYKHMQENKTTTIHLRSFAEKTLTYHQEIACKH